MTTAGNHSTSPHGRPIATRWFFRTILIFIWGILTIGCSENKQKPEPIRIYTVGDTIIYKQGDSTIQKVIHTNHIRLVHDSSYRDAGIQANDRHILIISLIILALIAATTLIILTIRKNHKIDDLASSIKSLNEQSDNISEIVSALVKDKVSVIRTLSDGKESFDKDERSLSHVEQMENLKRKVESYENQMTRIKDRQNLYSELENTLNIIYGGMMTHLRESLGESLKEEDYNIIACILSGMNSSSISFLTGITAPTLRTRKSRYKSRISSLPDSPWKETALDLFSNK